MNRAQAIKASNIEIFCRRVRRLDYEAAGS